MDAMTPAAFAACLVARLTPLLPAGFQVRADGPAVLVETPSGLGGTSTVLAHVDPEDAEPEDYADAAWNVLSMVQDVISETVTDPWPAAMGPSGDLAEPGTQADGNTIRLYFGADDQPVVVLEPIRGV